MKTEQLLSKELGRFSEANAVLAGDLYGIELENEAEPPFDFHMLILSANRQGFRVEKDQSLRTEGGFEFISSAYPLDSLEKQITGFVEETNDITWSNSRRTSTHIHMNFSDKTCFDLVKFITLYWIFEKVLLLSVKESRLDNTFCFSSVTTRDLILSLVELERFSIEQLNNPNAFKYNSINVAPLATQGTVEIRVFHGTMQPEVLLFWLHFLDKLLKMSKEYGSLKEILDDFNRIPASEFLLLVLTKGEVSKLGKVAIKRKTTIEDELREGFRYAIPVFRLDKRFKQAAEIQAKSKNLQKTIDEKLLDNLLFDEFILNEE